MGLVMMKKELPTRPLEVIPNDSMDGDTLWKALTQCWRPVPKLRPSAVEFRTVVSNPSTSIFVYLFFFGNLIDKDHHTRGVEAQDGVPRNTNWAASARFSVQTHSPQI